MLDFVETRVATCFDGPLQSREGVTGTQPICKVKKFKNLDEERAKPSAPYSQSGGQEKLPRCERGERRKRNNTAFKESYLELRVEERDKCGR